MHKSAIFIVHLLTACIASPEQSAEKGTSPKALGASSDLTIENNPIQAISKIPEYDSMSVDILHICTRFYNEICKSALGSPETIVNDMGYFILDLKSYKAELSKTSIFTSRFIEEQDSVFNDCRAALEEEKITPEEVWEGGIDMNAPYSCSFLNSNFYFNAQEDPGFFRLTHTRIKDSVAYTEMHYYGSPGGTSAFSWDDLVYLVITLRKTNGIWSIDRVQKKSTT